MELFVKIRTNNNTDLFILEKWMNLNPPHRFKAGFSSRKGGVSQGQWHSLNCAFHVDDDGDHVIQNREIVSKAAGFDFESWTCAEQVHSNDVYVVTEKDRGKGRLSRASAIQNKDALITNVPGILLTSFYADCVPLFFFDPVNHVVGLAHAGWKGTLSKIAEKSIHTMVHEYGSHPSNIKAAMGPAIGSCCYEVNDVVIEHFKQAHLSDGVIPKSNGRYWLDLKEINRQIMIEAGMMQTHIEISNLCTSCEVETFFSHRKEKGKTGRMVSFIGIEKR